MSEGEAGWYPDPKDPTGVRWFDGRFWTEHHGATPTWQTPPTVDGPARRRPGMLIAAGTTVGVLVLGLLVAAAVPVYRDGHERARLASVAATTCDDVADEAVELGRTEKQLEPLETVTGAVVARDARDAVQIPGPGAESFVMSCSAVGTRVDGSSAPLTIDLYIDHERTHLLWYTWNT
jgi:hypothetical protein